MLAPGIEFINPAGNYNAELTPHAWKAGPQTLLLKNQLSRDDEEPDLRDDHPEITVSLPARAL